MQIQSLPTAIPAASPPRERADTPRERPEAQAQLPVAPEPRQEAGSRRRVAAAEEAQQSRLQRDDPLDSVPVQNRGALRAYLDAGPTAEERLGVELAGIDVYA